MEPRSLQYIAEAMAGELRHGPPDTDGVAPLHRFAPGRSRAICFSPWPANGLTPTPFCPKSRGAAWPPSWRSGAKLPAGCQDAPVICGGQHPARPRPAGGALPPRFRSARDRRRRLQRQDHHQGTDRLGPAPEKAALWSEASFNNDIGVPVTLLRLEQSIRPPCWKPAPIIRANWRRCCK